MLVLPAIVLLTSNCVAVRSYNEGYFLRVATGIVEEQISRHHFTAENCKINYDKVAIFALPNEEVNRVSPFQFDVLGLYNKKGWIIYDKDEIDVLVHEYTHHLTSNMDRRCLNELTAQLVEKVYRLEMRMLLK